MQYLQVDYFTWEIKSEGVLIHIMRCPLQYLETQINHTIENEQVKVHSATDQNEVAGPNKDYVCTFCYLITATFNVTATEKKSNITTTTVHSKHLSQIVLAQ